MNCKPQTHTIVRRAAYRLGYHIADILPPVQGGQDDTQDAPLCHALLSCAVEVLSSVAPEKRSMPVTVASINGKLDHMLPMLRSWLTSGEFVPAGTEADDVAAQQLAALIGDNGIISSVVGGSDTLSLALMDASLQAEVEPCLFLYAQGFRGDACPQRACAILMEPSGQTCRLPVPFEAIMEGC